MKRWDLGISTWDGMLVKVKKISQTLKLKMSRELSEYGLKVSTETDHITTSLFYGNATSHMLEVNRKHFETR